jgi:endonuclease G
MRLTILVLGMVLALFSPVLGQDFYVEASRNAIVRDQPDKYAEPLLRLERGDQLNAVTDQQTNRFYKVFLPSGETGWVSSYVVRLYQGRAPEAPPVAVMPDVDGGLSASEREYAEFHLAIGKPKGYKEIMREGYTLGYDPKLKIPVWVQYRLTRERSADNSFPRTDSFEEDAVFPPQARATLNDYASLGGDYVRGHMAPAEDMRWSESAEEQSNLLTNIAPQIGSTFNGSIWKTIENRVRGWVIDREDLTIICGPVFESLPNVQPIERQPQTERQRLCNVIGENDVAVPTAFFKIVIDMRNQQNPDLLAFLVPHIQTEAGPERRIETHLTSVDRIEELTGLDFLTNLPQNVQENIESVQAASPW